MDFWARDAEVRKGSSGLLERVRGGFRGGGGGEEDGVVPTVEGRVRKVSW